MDSLSQNGWMSAVLPTVIVSPAGGGAVACAMGVIGGDLHHPEKEWSDMSSVKSRIALGRKVLELIAQQK